MYVGQTCIPLLLPHLPSQSAGTCDPIVKDATVLTKPRKLAGTKPQLCPVGEREADRGLPAACCAPAGPAAGNKEAQRHCVILVSSRENISFEYFVNSIRAGRRQRLRCGWPPQAF